MPLSCLPRGGPAWGFGAALFHHEGLQIRLVGDGALYCSDGTSKTCGKPGGRWVDLDDAFDAESIPPPCLP